ncbi:neuroglobin-like isoform X2 [Centruroides vittatus]|nr:neuroglobin-like [Centruroides sculpturatus]
MGCNVGRQTVLKGKTEEQLLANLTSRQIELVTETWQIVSQDMANVGVIIFQRLLTQHPELCKLFKKFMTLKEDGTYDWDLGGMERHALLVMQALEAAIDNLDDSRVLSGILFELGCKHARYNVQEDMFDKLWDALKSGLEETLQEQMTKEVTQAWFSVFRYISHHIVKGMRDYRKRSQ